MQRFIEIPYQALSQYALESLISTYLTRQGYDTSDTSNTGLQGGIERVVKKLKSKELVLIYDLETQTSEIMPAKQAKKWLQN